MTRSTVVIFALTALSHSAVAQTRDSSRLRVLEYRWVIGESVTSRGYVDPASGRTYLLSDTSVLDIDDVEQAEAHAIRAPGPPSWDVIVRLTPRGTAAFKAATAAHVGDMIAVLMDGRIVGTAVVESPLGSVAGVVSAVSKATADSLAHRINVIKSATTHAPP